MFVFFWFQGKVKSVFENMKTLQDPTPHFDSHVAKSASKVTSLSCHCAFEYTQVRLNSAAVSAGPDCLITLTLFWSAILLRVPARRAAAATPTGVSVRCRFLLL